jgi:hypothetical protein
VSEDEAGPTLGSLGGWVRDGALAGALMTGAWIGPMFAWRVTQLTQQTLRPQDVQTLVVVVASGCVIGALFAPVLRLYAGLSLRLGTLPALAAGPVAGAAAGLALIYAIAWQVGSPPPPGLTEGFCVAGAGALGPPWAAYLAVRVRQRATIGVVIGAAVWTTVPTGLLAGVYVLMSVWR